MGTETKEASLEVPARALQTILRALADEVLAEEAKEVVVGRDLVVGLLGEAEERELLADDPSVGIFSDGDVVEAFDALRLAVDGLVSCPTCGGDAADSVAVCETCGGSGSIPAGAEVREVVDPATGEPVMVAISEYLVRWHDGGGPSAVETYAEENAARSAAIGGLARLLGRYAVVSASNGVEAYAVATYAACEACGDAVDSEAPDYFVASDGVYHRDHAPAADRKEPPGDV